MAVKVIETTEDAHEYYKAVRGDTKEIPICLSLSSELVPHSRYSKCSLEYVWIDGTEYLFGFGHNDLPKLQYDNRIHYIARTFDMWYDNFEAVLDCSFALGEVMADRYTEKQRMYHRKFHGLRNINDAVPLAMHMEMFRGIRDDIRSIDLNATHWTSESLMYATEMYRMFLDIEEIGIAVDEKQFRKSYGNDLTRNIVDGMVFSDYNIHTRTGRPSNAYGGLNLAAIPKQGGYRESFVSRFDDGELVEVDFKSFHLYLLLNHLRIDPPAKNIHEWLAKKYFKTDSPTKEQYEESKKITFGQIYGQRPIDSSIPMFKEIQKFRNELWEQYQRDGVIYTPKKNLPIVVEDPTENRVFNYWVQATETETMHWLHENVIGSEFVSNHGYLVLYTYDAFLFDVPKPSNILFSWVAKMCEDHGYPVSIKHGPNYGSLVTYL